MHLSCRRFFFAHFDLLCISYAQHTTSAFVSSATNIDGTPTNTSSTTFQVCEWRQDAENTGGHHYVIVLLDCSKPTPSILNKDFLDIVGVKPNKDQSHYLDFEIDDQFINRFAKAPILDI